jgi:hypothetical protein
MEPEGATGRKLEAGVDREWQKSTIAEYNNTAPSEALNHSVIQCFSTYRFGIFRRTPMLGISTERQSV